MSRILRALVVSAVATTAAIVVTALLENRGNLSLDKMTASLTGRKGRAPSAGMGDSGRESQRTGSSAPVDSLTEDEQELLLTELQDHV